MSILLGGVASASDAVKRKSVTRGEKSALQLQQGAESVRGGRVDVGLQHTGWPSSPLIWDGACTGRREHQLVFAEARGRQAC